MAQVKCTGHMSLKGRDSSIVFIRTCHSNDIAEVAVRVLFSMLSVLHFFCICSFHLSFIFFSFASFLLLKNKHMHTEICKAKMEDLEV